MFLFVTIARASCFAISSYLDRGKQRAHVGEKDKSNEHLCLINLTTIKKKTTICFVTQMSGTL